MRRGATIVHRVRTSEWIVVGYYTVLVLACWIRPIVPMRRAIVSVASITVMVAIWRLSSADLPLIRLWAPLPCIPIGYYLCGLLWTSPSLRTERWLQAWDRRLLGERCDQLFANWPTPLLDALALCYSTTWLMTIIGLAVLLVGGHAAFAERYWTIVLGAQFASFAMLAVVQTRPPWAVDRVAPDQASIRGYVALLVERHLIGANTFPSGHVASSVAVALAVGGAMPWTGAVLLAIALCITLATITGRYHYVMDAVTGVLLAVSIWVAVSVVA
jgi:hypothetical protein